MTGLLNRKGLADRFVELSLSDNKVCTLFYLDLDGFKVVNDTHGHPAGDLLLIEVAHRLRGIVRVTDTLARSGDDEFLLVAPNLSAAEGHRLAEAIILRVAGQPYDLGGGVAAVIGISVGFACSPEDGSTLQILQHRADIALYEAKRAGKGVHRRFLQPISPPDMSVTRDCREFARHTELNGDIR